ncbi:hypothetical protein Bca101_056718 [Brassica carinata]
MPTIYTPPGILSAILTPRSPSFSSALSSVNGYHIFILTLASLSLTRRIFGFIKKKNVFCRQFGYYQFARSLPSTLATLVNLKNLFPVEQTANYEMEEKLVKKMMMLASSLNVKIPLDNIDSGSSATESTVHLQVLRMGSLYIVLGGGAAVMFFSYSLLSFFPSFSKTTTRPPLPLVPGHGPMAHHFLGNVAYIWLSTKV